MSKETLRIIRFPRSNLAIKKKKAQGPQQDALEPRTNRAALWHGTTTPSAILWEDTTTPSAIPFGGCAPRREHPGALCRAGEDGGAERRRGHPQGASPPGEPRGKDRPCCAGTAALDRCPTKKALTPSPAAASALLRHSFLPWFGLMLHLFVWEEDRRR